MPYDNNEDIRKAGYSYASDPRYTGSGGRSADGTPSTDESPASISTKNYEVPGGDYDANYFNAAAVGSQLRPGVQIDTSHADAALAHAMNNAWLQDQTYANLRNASQGGAPSAAVVGNQMALDDAIARQYAGGGSGGGQYLAGLQGAGAMGNINAQYAGARAGEIGQAQQAEAGFAGGWRNNLLQQMGQSQDLAYGQGQLNAAQMARNDEMARFYTGQGNQLNLDQLMANQAYEAQKGELSLRTRAAQQASADAADDRYNRRLLGGIGLATGGISSVVAHG